MGSGGHARTRWLKIGAAVFLALLLARVASDEDEPHKAPQPADIPLSKRDKATFHTLRHTAASLMVAGGVPIFDVAKILGHSTLAVTMSYARFAPKAGREAVARLGEALAASASRVSAAAASDLRQPAYVWRP